MALTPAAFHTSSIEFGDIAYPFLRVVAHFNLLKSPSVDEYRNIIYQCISTDDGSKVIVFSRWLCDLLVTEKDSEARTTGNKIDIVSVIAEVLYWVALRNPKVLQHRQFSALLGCIEKIYKHANTDTTGTKFLDLHHLRYEAIADIGDDSTTPSSTIITPAPTVLASPHLHTANGPGWRHDNDHLDITKIRIIPTENEIRCKHNDFLPSTNFESPSVLEGAERLIDTHFRLLRHEIFNVMKGNIAELLELQEKGSDIGPWLASSVTNRSMHVYNAATVGMVGFSQDHRLYASIYFSQPRQMSKKSTEEKLAWWKDNERLSNGCLVCLVWSQYGVSSVLFMTVRRGAMNSKRPASLAPKGGCHASIKCSLIPGQTACDLETLSGLYYHQKMGKGLLIEFPHILPDTFTPTLQNLQQMYREKRLPFSNWFVPKPGRVNHSTQMPPPLYARKAGFEFWLDSILKDKSQHLSIQPANINAASHRTLGELTTLNKRQCEAVCSAASSEVCLIQGPPGTGKSFVGVQIIKAFVANKVQANLGPILVVCQTNHALDQFLEHLVANGIDNITRIGSQSESELLKGRNLSVLAKRKRKAVEKRDLASLRSERQAIEKIIRQKVGVLQDLRRNKWKVFDNFLSSTYPDLHRQFVVQDTDDLSNHKNRKDPFSMWIKGIQGLVNEPGTPEDPRVGDLGVIINKAMIDVWGLSSRERKIVFNHLVTRVNERIIEGVLEDFSKDDELATGIRDIHDQISQRVLTGADVIGVTTTGLARRIPVLSGVKSKVVICEEAGEVHEAHMLSALIPGVQHLIQIGDHKQLRPHVETRELSMESHRSDYHWLDRSQFERLAMGEHGLPRLQTVQLNVQRRMRPDISTLIRIKELYPNLLDHDSVKGLPDVVGMQKNIFWLTHNHKEDNPDSGDIGHSKSNTWEVGMTCALVMHIMRQGVYGRNDIAVLTPYSGQLQRLHAAFQEDSLIPVGENLRIATVDSFQGEEAKVVIISLVRSNSSKEVGFLKNPNRINVLLSRAQHGMYLIGNSDTYSSAPMWHKVIEKLRGNKSIGSSLALCCPRHPDEVMRVSSPEEIAILSPQGGCAKPYQSKNAAMIAWKNVTPLYFMKQFDVSSSVHGNLILAAMSVQVFDRLFCFQTQNLAELECQAIVEKAVSCCEQAVKVRCGQDTSKKHNSCSHSDRRSATFEGVIHKPAEGLWWAEEMDDIA
ncbi:P-loop containing nucleoside triphosphate hydrolase protein [Aspergillus spectabilis]